MAKGSKGRVVQIIGPVVDVEFPTEDLPEINHAVYVTRRDGARIVLEVQQQLGSKWVRCIAMESTDGMQRGMEAVCTGAPIMVPVGKATLGRLFNVLGEVVGEPPAESGLGEFKPDKMYPDSP